MQSRARIDMYKQCDNIRYSGKKEKINLEYEQDEESDSEEEFTSESDQDMSSFEDDAYDEFVLTLANTNKTNQIIYRYAI